MNVYGEAYSSLSIGKLSGQDLSFGWFKDLEITGGVNLDSKQSGVGDSFMASKG